MDPLPSVKGMEIQCGSLAAQGRWMENRRREARSILACYCSVVQCSSRREMICCVMDRCRKNKSDDFILLNFNRRFFRSLVVVVYFFELLTEITFSATFHFRLVPVLAEIFSDIGFIELVIADDAQVGNALGKQA